MGMNMSFSVGDCVKVVGGTYEGETAKVYSVASKSVRLVLSGDLEPTGNIPFKNITRSASKKDKNLTKHFKDGYFSIGAKVEVIFGTHEGKFGKIYSVGEKTCRLILHGNPNPTGNIPFESISVITGKDKQDKNNNLVELKSPLKSE